MTVVTADRELKSRVRERKGRSPVMLPVSTIFEAAPMRRAVRRGPHEGHRELPAGHGRITAELRDIWLDGNEPGRKK